jgi:hypothetical protein
MIRCDIVAFPILIPAPIDIDDPLSDIKPESERLEGTRSRINFSQKRSPREDKNRRRARSLF